MSDFNLPNDRKTAKAAGIGKYFTGRPCKNSHMSYRYTNSGTCAECINGGRTNGVLMARAPKNPAHAEKLAILETFVRIKITVTRADIPMVREAVAAWALMRHPDITPNDVWSLAQKPDHGVLYTVGVHPEDVEQVRAFSNSVFSPKQDVNAMRTRVLTHGLGLSVSAASTPVAPVPEWAREGGAIK